MDVDLAGAKTGQALEQRLALLEDLEAIRNLKMLYASYCDQGYDPDGIVSLFIPGGVWESNVFGRYEGVEAIRTFMAGVSKSIVWVLHYTLNPLISVAADGQSASATWLLYGPATMLRTDDPSVQEPVVMTGKYDDRLVKHNGQWRFAYSKNTLYFVSNVEEGWVKQPFRP
ncbi:MAG: nuclear transport factor 2 family protein [Chloroflexi bacterium]|nr:nuclear transport factor 2 family protein [Chloroflexota bacterium]